MATNTFISAPKLARVGKYVLQVTCVGLSYFVAGRLGLVVPFTSGNVSPVWPASGIALAAVLLLRYRIWPGIALGAFLVNLLSAIPHVAAVGLAVGNTLAAVTGAFLLWRIPAYTPSLARLRDVIGLIVLGALGSSIVSASAGVAVLSSTQVHPWSAVPLAWFIYWLGDAMGVLLVAPLVLSLSSLIRMDRQKIVELTLLLTALTLACFAIFNDRWLAPELTDVLAFGIFPFIIWAAIRLGVGGASTAVAVVATIATVETALGSGPFAAGSPFRNSALLQLYFAVLAISGLSLAAVVGERERAEADREELIRQLEAKNAELQNQTDVVRELSGRLLEMQDEERRRLARELHDSIGQMLAAVKMSLSVVRVETRGLNPLVENAIMDVTALVDQITREIRTISYLLHPPLLDEAGLQSALRWFVDGFRERSNISTDLELPSNLGRLSPELEISIFRIVQEALTNIHRHSGSTTATVRIVPQGEELRLEIADAGRGIPTNKQLSLTHGGQAGVGIRGIRERLRQLGGRFELNSNSNGTIVTAVLPVTRAPRE